MLIGVGCRAFAKLSPSLRGRGLKSMFVILSIISSHVALFTRAWIEIAFMGDSPENLYVALFTRAWIEIACRRSIICVTCSRPLYEGVD